MDHSAFMFRILLGLFDPEKDLSKRREIFNQQHGVTSQKRWSNTAVRTSPLETLSSCWNVGTWRMSVALSSPNAVIMLKVSCGGSEGGVGGEEQIHASYQALVHIIQLYSKTGIFRKLEGVVGTGWSWLRIGTGGGHLWVRRVTFGFHKFFFLNAGNFLK